MYQQLKQQISKVLNLTDDEFEHFLTFKEVMHFRKKELLLRENEVCKYIWFINSGSLRYFYNVDGEQRTGQFFFENSWFTDFDSFLTGLPSKLYVEAMEKTEIIAFTKINLDKLYNDLPQFERFSRVMAETAFVGLRNKTEMLSNQNPQERYLNLIKDRPKLIERVPQHYIASYLGIKPQSLSRIRKKIFNKPNT